MVFGLIVIGLLSMLVAWHGDGQEVTRHTVEGLAELRLGLWILIVMWALEGVSPAPSNPPAARRRLTAPATCSRVTTVSSQPMHESVML